MKLERGFAFPADANNGGSKIHETIANKGARRFLTESVATCQVERVKGIEPSFQAWEAHVLPLNHTRNGPVFICNRGGRQAQLKNRLHVACGRILTLPPV